MGDVFAALSIRVPVSFSFQPHGCQDRCCGHGATIRGNATKRSRKRERGGGRKNDGERERSRGCVENGRKCTLAGRFLKIKWRPRRRSSDVAGDEEKGEEGERRERERERTTGESPRTAIRLTKQTGRRPRPRADQWRSTLIPTRDTR